MSGIARTKSGRNRKTKSGLWARHPEDWYVEPAWVSASIFAVERFEGRVWDPACGIGRIVEAAEMAGLEALGTDIVSRVPSRYTAVNFLTVEPEVSEPNIVSNIPFGLAQSFVEHALALAGRKVALLLPATWMVGVARSRWLETTPLRRVWMIGPRPSMPPGPVLAAGVKPGNGTQDYAWYVWLKGYDGFPEIRWLRREDLDLEGREPTAAISVFMGPEEKKRHTIKTSGQLKKPAGLPLFSKRRTVTRDSEGGTKDA